MRPDVKVCVLTDSDDLEYEIVNALLDLGFTVTTYSQAHAFLDQATSLGIDCAFIDLSFQDGKGIDVLQKFSKRACDCPVLLVDAVTAAGLAVNATGLGAAGIIGRPFIQEALLEAIERALASGGTKERVGSSEPCDQEESIQSLTRREREVLDLLVGGYQNKMIAHELGISQRTVEVHRARLMRRLKVKSFAELLRLAIDNRAAT